MHTQSFPLLIRGKNNEHLSLHIHCLWSDFPPLTAKKYGAPDSVNTEGLETCRLYELALDQAFGWEHWQDDSCDLSSMAAVAWGPGKRVPSSWGRDTGGALYDSVLSVRTLLAVVYILVLSRSVMKIISTSLPACNISLFPFERVSLRGGFLSVQGSTLHHSLFQHHLKEEDKSVRERDRYRPTWLTAQECTTGKYSLSLQDKLPAYHFWVFFFLV